MDSKLKDGFEFICKLSELKTNTGSRFIIDDIEIAVFKIDDNIFAVSNICPHQHTALIYEGIIKMSVLFVRFTDGCSILKQEIKNPEGEGSIHIL